LIAQPGAFQEAHNEYLQVWEELGIAAFLMFLLLLGIPLARSLSLLRSEKDAQRAYWMGTLGIALALMAIGCVTFFPLHLSVTAAYIVFLMACLRFFQTGEVSAPSRSLGTGSGRLRDPRRIALIAVLLAVVGWVGLRQRDKLRANQEMAVVVTLVENTLQPNLPARQKLVFAQEAMRRLDQIESWHPGSWQVHNLRGTAHLVRGQLDNAVDSFNRAAELVPSPEIYTNLAAAYLAQQRNEAAREALQIALRYNPSYEKARRALRQLESTDGG
jgi:tetratricopeptide (TPR) repeat protein